MKRGGLALAGLLLALVLGELLLRGLRPPLLSERDAAWQARTRALHTALYQPDPELGYVPRPSSAHEMAYGVARHDRWGFRDDDPAPATDQPRVAMLGDSLVWGELVGEHDTLPARLEAELGVEVLNLGVSGYATAQEVAWYRRKGRAFDPDLVVLVFCLNDLLTMSGPLQVYGSDADLSAYQAERARLDARAPFRNETASQRWFDARSGDGSQVRAMLAYAWAWHRLFTMPGGYVDELLLSLEDLARVQALRAALGQLGDTLREDGTPGALVVAPGLYWWHRYPWHPLHELAHEAGEAAGLLVLDPLPEWRDGDPNPWRFPGDNLHYNAEGNAAFAAWLAAELRRSGLAPAPATATSSGPRGR